MCNILREGVLWRGTAVEDTPPEGSQHEPEGNAGDKYDGGFKDN
jgi:hypothetical protein